MPRSQPARKKLGQYYTPPDLVDLLVERTFADIDAAGDWAAWLPTRPVRVLDPACGDGRLLERVRVELHMRGYSVDAVGCDLDADALASVSHPRTRTFHANALEHDWGDERFDIVIGNPPYLSQMAASTSRGGSSKHGGGPYADAAAEFLALAVALADPDHGRVSLVLPQSILASRDAGPIRARVDEQADLVWSWWSTEQEWFDAAVNVCVVGLRRPAAGRSAPMAWTRIVTDVLGIPHIDPATLTTQGTIGDRADLNANFRDEYYALVPAVGEDIDGPPLVTSGLIDPAHCSWGERRIKFNKQFFQRPRVDLSKLEGRFVAWAERKLVPKVLVANQTKIVEAVADVDGAWVPGVPVTTIIPTSTDPDEVRRTVFDIEAILCSPIASAMCWHLGGGTGLSTKAVRVSPGVLADVPWPAGDLSDAVDACRRGDIVAAGRLVLDAYGCDDATASALLTWWAPGLPNAASGDAAGD
ncbi:N-6 DNA methylase [Ilumatobacter fluminis]|uniref:N-6 DNA methylase n=1 Tax=Ilumatobacter fluminis TaxID=467091 RepID=A0A4V3EIM6_9ACTN|nr:N-6 DNA methylase [Ilumatobacter fluminis]TDT15048.1 N-6 DNA methylase [Ilumatobacter fluminis]